METFYFNFGIAFVVILAVAGLSIWAGIKVAKLSHEMKVIQRKWETTFANTSRDLTMVDKTLTNGLNLHLDKVFHELDGVRREMDDRADKALAYTDSRFDKLDNKVQACWDNKTPGKQLLKG
tara:strand:- start:1028 stop:1393 length:366 start_codon:yes stop_codon:yes gene_type:complete